MDESHRRVSAKAALFSGHRNKLVAALILAVSAAGYIALESANIWPGKIVGKLSGTDCIQNHYFGADTVPECNPVKTNTNNLQESDSSKISADPQDSGDSLRDEMNAGLVARHSDEPRPWISDPTNIHGPRPGQTMAELCMSGLDEKGFSCQTGNYGDTLNRSESGADSESASKHTISGRVLTTEGIGLAGITIVASPERLKSQQLPDSGTLRFLTLTDSLGAYSLERLPDGEYTIRSSTRGAYRSARISARVGVRYADLVVSRNAEMVAEGQVVTATGEPLEGVTVLPLLLGQPSVLTDYDGRFRLPVALKPAVTVFTLRFQRPGYQEQSGKVQFQHADAPNAAMVNVVMHPVESWTELNGTVYGDSGESLAGRAVELRPQFAQRTYSTTTDNDGKYSFPIVEAPADYQLIVFGGADHKDYQQPVHMTVDTTELDVVIESYEFGEVTGQLVNLTGEPVPDFDLVLRNTGSRKPNVVVSTDERGNFEIPAAPAGQFVVASRSTPSILVQGLRLQPGEKLRLPLVLDWGQHEIRGLVVDAHGNPVPASRIILQWSHKADGVTTRATRRTAADTQGYFAFNNLGPGPHLLRIDAPGFSPVDIDHDLSRQGYDVTVRLN